MSIAELKVFPLPPMADDSMLLLWRVSSMVEEAYEVARSWNYRPVSEIIWQKLTRTGKHHFGMGHYVRASHETCILATRGRFKVANRGVRSTFEAPVVYDGFGKIVHSAKPTEFYDLVETLAAGPYAELFARRRRANWRQFGLELPHGQPHPMIEAA